MACYKKRYATKGGARTAVKLFSDLKRYYWCDQCVAYHTTSTDKEEYEQRKQTASNEPGEV